MNKLLLVFILIFSSVSLQAYAKRVILSSFSTKQRAQSMLDKLPQISPSIYKLAKTYGFEIKLKESGKYYILYAEVFRDKKVLNNALKKIRKRFKGAYVSSYTYPKETKKIAMKKVEPVKVLPKEVNTKSPVEAKQNLPKDKREALKPENIKAQIKTKELVLEDKPEVLKPTTQIKPVQKVVQAINKKEVQEKVEIKGTNKTALEQLSYLFTEYINWSYLIIFVLSIVVIRYYIKFKRIYDEY